MSFFLDYVFTGDRDGVCVHMDADEQTDQKKVVSPLELGFLAVMSHLTWVSATKPASAAKAICGHKSWAFPPAPKVELRETCTALNNYEDLILVAHFGIKKKGKEECKETKLNPRYVEGNKQFVQIKDTKPMK